MMATPHWLQTSRYVSTYEQGVGDCEERGETDMGGERGPSCIVPLQGSRCCGPHSGGGPRGGGQTGKVKKGPRERLRPYASTSCPGSSRSMHVTGHPPPQPYLGERTSQTTGTGLTREQE